MTDAELKAIQRRAKRVFPRGSWDGDEAERALEVVVEDVPALLAEVRRLTAELSYAGRPRYSGDTSVAVEAIDAAFTRGVEAMREAATKACARVEDEAELSSEGDVAMRCANRIRSLKVSP